MVVLVVGSTCGESRQLIGGLTARLARCGADIPSRPRPIDRAEGAERGWVLRMPLLMSKGFGHGLEPVSKAASDGLQVL